LQQFSRAAVLLFGRRIRQIEAAHDEQGDHGQPDEGEEGTCEYGVEQVLRELAAFRAEYAADDAARQHQGNGLAAVACRGHVRGGEAVEAARAGVDAGNQRSETQHPEIVREHRRCSE
jgi:hypothetical protein